jgi:hypothetical protein
MKSDKLFGSHAWSNSFPGFDWAILQDFKPRLALVDESHNFRHSDTEQYRQTSAYLGERGLPAINITVS